MVVKERIILGSLELMKVKGIRHTTMDSVAQDIGVSKRTIYEHFVDKEGLVIAVIERLINDSKARKQKIYQCYDDMIDSIFAMLDEVDKDFMLHGQISNDVHKHYPHLFKKYFVKHYDEVYRDMVEGFAQGVEMGYIKEDIDLKFAAYVIMESIFNLMSNYQRVSMVSNISPNDAFKYMFIHFIRGIATAKGVDKIDSIASKR